MYQTASKFDKFGYVCGIIIYLTLAGNVRHFSASPHVWNDRWQQIKPTQDLTVWLTAVFKGDEAVSHPTRKNKEISKHTLLKSPQALSVAIPHGK